MDNQQNPPSGNTGAPWRARPQVIEPFSQAWNWMVHVLFTTGTAGKWFGLAFGAFLTALGGSLSNSFNFSTRFGEGFLGESDLSSLSFENWIDENFGLFLLILALATLFLIAIVLITTFLSSRGHFMLVDGVLKNRGLVRQPWRQFSKHANALFRFQLLLAIALFVFTIVFAALFTAAVVVISGMAESSGSFGFIALLVLMLIVSLVLGVAVGVLMILIFEFSVPVMWLRGIGPTAALREVVGLIRPHLITFVLYVLFKLLLGIAIGIFAFAVVCATCCIAAIPYVGTVIMLPVFVLQRSFSLHFLAQFHPDFAPFAPKIEPLFDPTLPGPTSQSQAVGTDEPWARPPQTDSGADSSSVSPSATEGDESSNPSERTTKWSSSHEEQSPSETGDSDRPNSQSDGDSGSSEPPESSNR